MYEIEASESVTPHSCGGAFGVLNSLKQCPHSRHTYAVIGDLPSFLCLRLRQTVTGARAATAKARQ
jgi:hypothetical protein